MKLKQLAKTTCNQQVYRIVYKSYVLRKSGGCDRCPWHNKENYRGGKDTLSWKTRRKVRRQFRRTAAP